MALIYVGDMDRASTEAYFRSVVEAYGPAKVTFVSDFAFVEIPDDGQAQKAISDLHKRGIWEVCTVVADDEPVTLGNVVKKMLAKAQAA